MLLSVSSTIFEQEFFIYERMFPFLSCNANKSHLKLVKCINAQLQFAAVGAWYLLFVSEIDDVADCISFIL
jgi:hypothetical protein